jgi:uncharacterized phage protein (TIGR01671 family)
MQFTGLLDKNGKEIWEGDVIKFEDSEDFYVVDFSRGKFGASYKSNWDAKPDEMIFGSWRDDFNEYKVVEKSKDTKHGDVYELLSIATVLGNIHANPDLLKDKPVILKQMTDIHGPL